MKNRITSVALGAAIIVLGSAGVGFAAGQIGSSGIADNSVRSIDMKDDEGVGRPDLKPGLRNDIVSAANATPTTVNFGTANGDSRVADERTIILEGDNTSVEATGVGINVSEGDIISFEVTTQGTASCTAGSPRMYVTIDGNAYNSYDADNSTHGCPGDNAPPSPTDGLVHFVVPEDGTIGDLFFVNDNGLGGTVYINNLLIDGTEVLFG